MQDQTTSTTKLQLNSSETSHQPSAVDLLLFENWEIMTRLNIESKLRRNKNIMNNNMCLLVHRLEKNLIKLAKHIPPECMGEPHHMEAEKNRFINFYKSRNGVKK